MGFIDVPLELVDAIVDELATDMESLQACSLVAPVLRNSSQRILFCSLIVKCWESPDSKAAKSAVAFLQESPHLICHITRLKVELRLPADVDSLHRILKMLVKVRRCEIAGSSQAFPFDPEVETAFLDFVARQPLRELHLRNLVDFQVPRFLRAAPFLSFGMTSPGPDMADPLVKGSHCIRDLVLNSGSDEIVTLFCTPAFQSHIEGLSRLCMIANEKHISTLLVLAAKSLQHLYLHCHNNIKSPMLLSSLPALRFLDLSITVPRSTVWFLDTISSILTAGTSVALACITLHFPYSWPELPSSALATLDQALVTHPTTPRMCWRINYMFIPERPRLPPWYPGGHLVSPYTLVSLINNIVGSLPLANARDRLEVKNYKETPDQWASRPYA